MPLSGHSGHFSNKIQKNTPSSRPARTKNLDSTLQPTFLKQSPNLYSLPYALPISRKHTQNARKRSCNTRPCTPELPANNLQATSQPRSNNRRRNSVRFHMLLQSLVTTRKTLVNTRKRSCITRPCTPKLPANNLQATSQRRSNNRRRNSVRFHMLHQSLVTTRKRSCITRPCTPKLPANNLPAAGQRRSNNRPPFSTRCQMLHQSLVNTRETLVNARTSAHELPASCLHLSQNTHTSTRLFATPLPSRKSPKNPANPASDNQTEPLAINPPQPTILPLPHFQYRLQAVLLSPIHYPLQFPLPSPLLVISPQPCYRVPTVSTAARSGSSGGENGGTD